jgi:hypothetical protein
MTQAKYKSVTVLELIDKIYDDNSIHFDFDEDMNGGDCDCNLHTTLNTIVKYME